MDREKFNRAVAILEQQGMSRDEAFRRFKSLGSEERIGLAAEAIIERSNVTERFEAGDPNVKVYKEDMDRTPEEKQKAMGKPMNTVVRNVDLGGGDVEQVEIPSDGVAGAVAGFAAGLTRAGALHAVQPVAARAMAALDEVSELFGGVAEKDFKDRVNQYTRKIKAASIAASEENPIAAMAGDMVNFFVDPTAKVGKLAKGGKLAYQVMGQIARLEGTKNVIDILDELNQGEMSDSKGFNVEKLASRMKEGAVDTAIHTAIAGVATGALAVAGKAAAKKWANISKRWVGEEGSAIIDGASDLVDMGIKNVDQANAALGKLYGQTVGLYKSARQALYDGIEKAAPGEMAELGKFISGLDHAIDGQAAQLARAAANKVKPQDLIESVVGLTRTLELSSKSVSDAFGQGLKNIYKETAKKAHTGGKQLVDDFANVFVTEGTLYKNNKGKFVAIAKEHATVANWLNNKSASGQLSMKDLVSMKTAVSGKFTNAPEGTLQGAVENSWKGIRNALVDKSVWGEKAAGDMNQLLNGYMPAKKLLNSVTKQLTAATESAKAATVNGTMMGDDIAQSFTKILRPLVKGQEKMAALAGDTTLPGVLNKEQVQTVTNTVKAVREGLEWSKLAKMGNARKELQKFAASTPEEQIANQPRLVELLGDWQGGRELLSNLHEVNMASKLKMALLNPKDKGAVSAAKDWLREYAGDPKLGAEFNKLLNRYLKYQRLSKSDDIVNPQQMLKSLRDELGDDAIRELDLAHNVTHEIRKTLSDEKLLTAYIKENPGVFRGFLQGIREKMTTVYGGSAAVGAVAGVVSLPMIAAAAAASGVLNLIKRPQHFVTFLEKQGRNLPAIKLQKMKVELHMLDMLKAAQAANIPKSTIDDLRKD